MTQTGGTRSLPALPGAGRWSWVLLPAAIAVASRLYSAGVLLALGRIGDRRWADPFTVWDAAWYLRVARDGYHGWVVYGGHDFAFFPAWPLLIKVATLGLLPPAGTAVVLANAMFVAAAVVIWRVLERRLGSATATGGIALLSFAPSAYVFSLAYSEPLFLLVTGAFFATRATSRWRGPLAAVASLARIAGASLVATAAYQAVVTRGPERRTAILAVLGGTLGFAIWWLFVAHLTGHLGGFMQGSPSWIGGGSGLERILHAVRHPTVRAAAWLAFLAVMTVGALLLLRRDRELAVFALATLALALLPGGTVNSMPRYALSAFPAFAGLAGRLGRRGTIAMGIVFAIAQVPFVYSVLAKGGAAP